MSLTDNSFPLKVIQEIDKAIKQDQYINSFEVIPCLSSENKNSSPVLRGPETLGLESWAVRHVLPYAHSQILNVPLWKDPAQVIACVLTVNLLHPEMSSAWNRRRELVVHKKILIEDEWRITRMVLSRVPKSNEVLSYRRWLIKQFNVEDKDAAMERELELLDLIADRYHSNYHAWSHRRWCLQHFASVGNDICVKDKSIYNFTIRNFDTIYQNTPLSYYSKELSSNYDFVMSHVSDFSGLDYRSFLLQQIFVIFCNYANSNNNRSCIEIVEDGSRKKDAFELKQWLVNNIKELFEGAGVDCDSYLSSLDEEISLNDVIIGFLLGELRNIKDFIDVFPGHEALWSYRKFLMLQFKISLAHYNGPTEQLFYNLFLRSEKCKRSLSLHADDEDPRILKNFSFWLKEIVKFQNTSF